MNLVLPILYFRVSFVLVCSLVLSNSIGNSALVGFELDRNHLCSTCWLCLVSFFLFTWMGLCMVLWMRFLFEVMQMSSTDRWNVSHGAGRVVEWWGTKDGDSRSCLLFFLSICCPYNIKAHEALNPWKAVSYDPRILDKVSRGLSIWLWLDMEVRVWVRLCCVNLIVWGPKSIYAEMDFCLPDEWSSYHLIHF